MCKTGYTITLNSTNNYTLRSTLYIVYDDPTGLLPAFMTAFENYLQSNIQTFWTSSSNFGLQAPFNNSGITINTIITIVRGWPAVDFNRFSIRDSGGNRKQSLNQGECIIYAQNSPNRSYVNTGSIPKARGNFFHDQNNLRFFKGNTCSAVFNYNLGSYNSVTSIYNEVGASENFPCHEYGHILGLDDRYIPLFQGRLSGIQSRIYLIGDKPMYLDGLFDPLTPPAKPSGGYSPPPYNQLPYLTGNTPQNNYNDTSNFYDIEYSTRFGWEHNIMSRTKSPGGGNPSVHAANPTYISIYGPRPVGSPLTDYTSNNCIIISQKQLSYVLNYCQYEKIFRYACIINYQPPNPAPGTFNNFHTTDIFANNNGSFVGKKPTRKNPGFDETGEIVSDSGFVDSTTVNLGIDDVMDYRMSSISLALNQPDKLNRWDLINFGNSGYFNPFLKKNGEPHTLFTLNQLSLEINDPTSSTNFIIQDAANTGRYLEKGNVQNSNWISTRLTPGNDTAGSGYDDIFNSVVNGFYFFGSSNFWDFEYGNILDLSSTFDINVSDPASNNYANQANVNAFLIPAITPIGWAPTVPNQFINFITGVAPNIDRVSFRFFHNRIMLVRSFL